MNGEPTSEVFKHKGRKFRKATNEYGDHSPSPPSTAKPSTLPSSRSVILPPPSALLAAAYSNSKNRPISAKGRPRPQSLKPTMADPASEYRLQFALKRSKPLPPIPDQPSPPNHQHKLYDVDSAVDLDYTSQCCTPIDLPSYFPTTYSHPPTSNDSAIESPSLGSNRVRIAKQESERVLVSGGDPPLVGRRSSLPVHTSVQLGLKLPNGDRIESEFSLSSTLQDVVDCAERSSGVDLRDCLVSTNGVPRTVFNDKTRTLYESGINVRTVLYFSFP